MDLWICGFIRRSLLATYNNLFYRIHFIVFKVRYLLLWFLAFAELRWTQQESTLNGNGSPTTNEYRFVFLFSTANQGKN